MPLTINGRTVADSIISEEENRIREYYQKNLSEEEFQSIQEHLSTYARENIIGMVVLEEEVEKSDLQVKEEEVKFEFERMQEHYGGTEQFRKHFCIGEGDDSEILKRIEKSIKTDMLMQVISRDIPETTVEEADKFYQEHKDRYSAPERVWVSHILRKASNDKEKKKALKELKELKPKVQKLDDFKEQATLRSDCPSREREGDIGYIVKGKTVKAFENAAFTSEVGTVSGPIETEFGCHLLYIHDRKTEGIMPLDEVMATIKREIYQGKKNARISEHINELKAKAEISDSR